MIALVLLWCLIVGVSLAIALVVGWFTSPRTVGILYIVASIAFGGAVFDNILNGTTQVEYSLFAWVIVFTFLYLGQKFIREFPEY